MGKRPTLVTNGKFVDNMAERDTAIGLAKRFERVLQRVSAGEDLHDAHLHDEWQRCRRHLAQLVGARPIIQLSKEDTNG